MLARIGWRMLRQTDPRLLWTFVYQMGWKGMRALNRFKRRARRGERVPAFVFISVTDACNLRCQGCWVTPSDPPRQMDPDLLEHVLCESKRQGSHFFGILGGEPLLYPHLFDVLARHRDCYFQVFTNGTLLTEETARRMKRLGNITPLISIEGLEETSDRRRGGTDVYARAMAGVRHCTREGLITGIATSVCRSNIDELATQAFVDKAVALGVQYLWYHIYRPVGPMPCPELALSEAQITWLRRFLVEVRERAPIMIVDAYWDHEGRALCPAAVGISHHIGPSGDIEPCPPIQFAADRIRSGQDLAAVFNNSRFLHDFAGEAAAATRGCLLLESPARLGEVVRRCGAHATSGREAGMAELDAMGPLPSHHLPGREVPERNWFYRLAKKNWFFGFGAYG